MIPVKGEWTPFTDIQDKLVHFRLWGLIPPKSTKLRPIMVTDGYFGVPEPCDVVGYQTDNWAVIELADGFYAIHGDYLAELQPVACQRLPFGVCFAEVLSDYVVIDIETTGFDHRHDRIIEIAAVTYKYGSKVSEFHSLVNPGMLLPPDIISMTGIAQEQVDSAPFLDSIESEFYNFIGNRPIVGHNAASFDVPFLSAQMSVPIGNPVIDTLPMAKSVFSLLPRHKLEYLKNVLLLSDGGSHRALADVETTNALLWACLAPRKYESLVYRAYLEELINHTVPTHKPKRAKSVSSTPVKRTFEKVNIKSIVPSCECTNSESPLCEKNVVFTGSLSISREDAMQLAVDAGAVLKSSVSRKTDYLVVGTQDIALVGMDGKSSKEEKAFELNQTGKAQIKIINEKEFIELAKKEGTTV